jgi:hypothetical protein
MTEATVETHLRPVDNQTGAGAKWVVVKAERSRGRAGVVEVADVHAGPVEQVFQDRLRPRWKG